MWSRTPGTDTVSSALQARETNESKDLSFPVSRGLLVRVQPNLRYDSRVVNRQRLYDYGAFAWLWRAMMLAFIALGIVFLGVWLASPALWPLVAAFALLGPTAFFGTTVVVAADRLEDGGLDVQTLLFVRRRVAAPDLGAPRVRVRYHSLPYSLSAPRVWIPVKGGLPLYFDLLGHIPDRQRFLSAIGLRAREITVAE